MMTSCYRLKSNRSGDNDEEESLASQMLSARVDPFVGSQHVIGLNCNNFGSFLRAKEVAMVMFYLRNDNNSAWSSKHFKKAAEMTSRRGHVFAAIDCGKNSDLCLDEGVAQFPHFKIYARGDDVGFNSDAQHFFHQDMKTWVEGIPVISPDCV